MPSFAIPEDLRFALENSHTLSTEQVSKVKSVAQQKFPMLASVVMNYVGKYQAANINGRKQLWQMMRGFIK